eukprot:CAMPEP_0175328462 /NCGR_PEP_ID=MMETSP0093-20121207/75562_1 /TAXON_ID=311494 /ORGANISM="Alexandrium monilatum, Strain CCMP3105" /LENGTH=38 /DNA_ID= /DNA_START= /DNA_END= /DNA_ORIENTATION=
MRNLLLAVDAPDVVERVYGGREASVDTEHTLLDEGSQA